MCVVSESWEHRQSSSTQRRFSPVQTSSCHISTMAKGDPRKPKGRMSAYAFFIQTCREEHNKKSPEVPISFADFSRKCSGRWKSMSGKEKSRFEELARQDKMRFDQEMQLYAPGRKRGQKKDPNAPKRPPSGFFIFCSEYRPKVKAQDPSLGIGDVAKKLGEMWNNLADSSKQPYLQKANKLKDKYNKDVADYKSKGKLGPKPMMHNHDDDDDDEEDDDDEDEEDDEDDDE
ncbi:high mobility group protein B3a [Myripristis murdjan]|uniref:High mobility group protein B3 n=1 Tax=Myripristis murdjan TaxID=586833 RepID=A0A667XZN3_9TELE|nr:high mobility group protein B3-like [Myripristis murdjan]